MTQQRRLPHFTTAMGTETAALLAICDRNMELATVRLMMNALLRVPANQTHNLPVARPGGERRRNERSACTSTILLAILVSENNRRSARLGPSLSS
jgi:hypothetical protein